MLSRAFIDLHVKGLSLNAGVKSFDLERQRSFNQGQMYVALNRVRDIKNLQSIGTYNCKAYVIIKRAPIVTNFKRPIYQTFN